MNPPSGPTRIHVLTPLMPGAIAVIRLVGPESLRILTQVFKPARAIDLRKLGPERLVYGQLVEHDEPLDDVVVGVTQSPTESSRSRVVDINAHGGVRIVQRIVSLLEAHGATLARAEHDRGADWPGADAIQCEIDGLLPKAKTRRVAEWLAHQRVTLPAALRAVARQLDAGLCDEAVAQLRALLAGYPIARRLIDGVTVAILGPVNAGKSTLANRLIGRDQNIAADQPGTTRDWVTGSSSLDGIPVEWIDTAGLRDSDDPLEREAMDRGLQQAGTADVILWVIDGTRAADSSWKSMPLKGALRARAYADLPRITVINKADLPGIVSPTDLPAGFRPPVVLLSALRGDGIADLFAVLVDTLDLNRWADEEPVLVTPRQQDRVRQALEALRSSRAEAARRTIEKLIG